MQYNITDCSTKKYGRRCRVTFKKSSIEDLDLFKAVISAYIDCTGRDSAKNVLHSLLSSNRSFKYYVNGNVDDAYNITSAVDCDFYRELKELKELECE